MYSFNICMCGTHTLSAFISTPVQTANENTDKKSLSNDNRKFSPY